MSTEQQARSLVSEFNFSSRRAHGMAVSLMVRALGQDRGDKMLERIGTHFNRAHDMPEGHESGLALAQFYDAKCGPSQALRKMSLRTGHVYEDNALVQPTIN